MLSESLHRRTRLIDYKYTQDIQNRDSQSLFSTIYIISEYFFNNIIYIYILKKYLFKYQILS